MGISEETLSNTQEILENQEKILAAIKAIEIPSVPAEPVEPPPEPEPEPEPGPEPGLPPVDSDRFVWEDNLRSDVDMPMVFGPPGVGYLHQGMGSMVRTSEGLKVDYILRPWKQGDGPRNEFGRWRQGVQTKVYQPESYQDIHWYSFKIKINERDQDPPDDHNKIVVFQLHGPSHTNPILSLNQYTQQRRWVWWSRSQTKPHRVVWPEEGKSVGEFSGNMTYDTWVHWVVKIRFSLSNGTVELYRNGRLEYSDSGETCFEDTKPPTQQMGIYYPHGRKESHDYPNMHRRVWFKDYKIGDRRHSLSDFD